MNIASPPAPGCLRQRALSTGRCQLSAWQAVLLCSVTALAAGVLGRASGTRGARPLPPHCAPPTSLEHLVRSLPMANEQPPLARRPVVLLFGDSLTERSLDPEGG